MLAESIDQFGSSSEDDLDDDDIDQADRQHDVDQCHVVDHSYDDDDLDIDKGTDLKNLMQERDEDSQSINSVAR